MTENRFVEMGQIVAPSGIRGEVKINPCCAVSDFAAYAPFYDGDGRALKVLQGIPGSAFRFPYPEKRSLRRE